MTPADFEALIRRVVREEIKRARLGVDADEAPDADDDDADLQRRVAERSAAMRKRRSP